MAEVKINTKDYPSNSRNKKNKNTEAAPAHRTAPPVTTDVKVKKRTLSKKFGDVFLSSDADSVGNYILYDVFLPALKRTISDMVNKGVNMFLFGNANSGPSSPSSPQGNYVSYRNYYDSRQPAQQRVQTQSYRYTLDDIIFRNQWEAEAVLDELIGHIAEYGAARVSDLYEAVDVTPRWTDNKYGWTNLSNATIGSHPNGYVIHLPRARALD